MENLKVHYGIHLLIILFLLGSIIDDALGNLSEISEKKEDAIGSDRNAPYRPFYHLSAKDGRIGDPNGTIRYKNKYHLFGWREHFISKDLVHWEELPPPMHGDNGTFSYFSGSVVVDTANTGDFGIGDEPAMIAIYTMHHRNHSDTPDTEEQAISVSTDHIRFNFWEDNPVISSEEQFFRDPQVFWDEENEKWVMVVVKPDDKAIEIYSSPDLKNWEYESTFGPMGAQRAFWEVPDLFQLSLDGNKDEKKWVMICGVGPNTVQYWVGDFDGSRFIVDETTSAYLNEGSGLVGKLFENFEGDSYGGWRVEGSAFSSPGSSKEITGYLGKQLAFSDKEKNGNTGKLISPSFTIENRYINLLMAGTVSESTGVHILVNGDLKKSKYPIESDHLVWTGIDVSPWIGEQAHIEIVDNDEDHRIAVDHILFSDILYETGREHAYWIDWGEDFYAPRTFRDYDNLEDRKVWIAWLGNWTYARELPTAWGGSAQSIPREITLISGDTGYELNQKPVAELKKLRSDLIYIENKMIDNEVTFEEFDPEKNSYEIKATFELSPGNEQNFGLNLAKGNNNKVVIGYDAVTSNIYLDRTKSGNVTFNSEFPTISQVPFVPDDNHITFHVFVDQLSVEVFVNGGKKVLTSKIFPDASDTEIEFFSMNGKTILSHLYAWKMKSIWGND